MNLGDILNVLALIASLAAAVAIATNANSQGFVSAFFKGFNGAIKAETLQG